jgi:hypothetical protein
VVGDHADGNAGTSPDVGEAQRSLTLRVEHPEGCSEDALATAPRFLVAHVVLLYVQCCSGARSLPAAVGHGLATYGERYCSCPTAANAAERLAKKH